MAFGKTMLTAGILVVAGFWGGFLLSKGSGQILGMKPPHKASAGKANHTNETVALGIMKAADPDGEGTNTGHHAGLGQGGGTEDTVADAEHGPDAAPGSGGAQDAGGEDAAGHAGMDTGTGTPGDTAEGSARPGDKRDGERTKATGSGGPMAEVKTADGSAPKSTTAQVVALAGTQAATFLVGNTVDASLPNEEPHLTVYTARGLRADGHEGSFLVKPWNPKAASLCEPGSDGALVCRPMQVRADASVHAMGDRIGMMLVAGDRWVPIYKGDKLGVPAHIPFLDSQVADAEPAAISPKATAKGQPALDALVGHAASIDSPGGGGDQPATIVYYGVDGRRVTMTRPDDMADLSEGLAISVGRWSFSKGVLCQGDGTFGIVQTCSRPEMWGKTTIRLVPTKKMPTIQLSLLAETPKPHLEAAN